MIHEQNELVKPSGRYVQLPDCILKETKGAEDCVTGMVYLSIKNAAFKYTAKVTAKTIGENLGLSERTAQKAIRRLVERGHIEIVERKGKVLTVSDTAGIKNDAIRAAKIHAASGADAHVTGHAASVAEPVTPHPARSHAASVAELSLVNEHEKSAPPSLTSTSYMHEETSASNSNSMSANMQIEQDGMSASKHEEQLSMSASNSEDMNSCNSRQEEEVSEKLEEEDSFKNFGRQDGMRDLLTQVSMNHMPKFHIPTSGEHDDEHDGKRDSLRESMPENSSDKTPWVQNPSAENPSAVKATIEKVAAVKDRTLDTLGKSELLAIGEWHAFLYGDFRKQADIERQGAWIAGLLKRLLRSNRDAGMLPVNKFLSICQQARLPGKPQTDLSIVETMIPEPVGSK